MPSAQKNNNPVARKLKRGAEDGNKGTVAPSSRQENNSDANNLDINKDYIPENQGEDLWAGEKGGGLYDDVENTEEAMGETIINNDDEDEEMNEDDAILDNGDDDMMDKDDLDVYLPGQTLEKDEELVADLSTYELLQSMGSEWPCLTFDILKDNLGFGRTTFPATFYMVAGSQADSIDANKIYIMKLSKLHRTKQDDDDDAIDLDNPNDDEDPVLEHRTIMHKGTVNRLRVMPSITSSQAPQVVATWSDMGKVHLFDISTHVNSLDTTGIVADKKAKPFYTVNTHKSEGYALDWSRTQQGHLLSGDCHGKIFYSMPQSATSFTTDTTAFTGHTDSVEDLQWSPRQNTVFASASVDRTIKIWDSRKKNGSALSVLAHDSDVNVISWNHLADHLIASGSDNGDFAIWDLRMWKPDTKADPAARFKWHNGPITAIEWKPKDASTLAVAGADDQLTIWDIALERDQEQEQGTFAGVEVPPQLLFVHQGQHDLKEFHWHPQIDGMLVSAATEGFNMFKTINS